MEKNDGGEAQGQMKVAGAMAKKVEMPFIELYKFLYIDSDCLFCPANCLSVCVENFFLIQREKYIKETY